MASPATHTWLPLIVAASLLACAASSEAVDEQSGAVGDANVGDVCKTTYQVAPFGSTACQTCLETKCCAELRGCFNLAGIRAGADKATCESYADCTSECQQKRSPKEAADCQQLCDRATPGFVASYDAIVACAEKPANCAAACEFETGDLPGPAAPTGYSKRLFATCGETTKLAAYQRANDTNAIAGTLSVDGKALEALRTDGSPIAVVFDDQFQALGTRGYYQTLRTPSSPPVTLLRLKKVGSALEVVYYEESAPLPEHVSRYDALAYAYGGERAVPERAPGGWEAVGGGEKYLAELARLVTPNVHTGTIANCTF